MRNNDLVLTSKHLALLRASLRFWRDEMPGVEHAIIAAYFDCPVVPADSDAQKADELIDALSHSRLRYALLNGEDQRAVGAELFELVGDVRLLREGRYRIATVLSHE